MSRSAGQWSTAAPIPTPPSPVGERVAQSSSLNILCSYSSRVTQFLVRVVGCRIVRNVDSIGIVVLRCCW